MFLIFFRLVSMNKFKTNLVLLLGRLLIATIFIMSGLHKITAFAGTSEQIAEAGVPLASYVTYVVILLELIGGGSVAVGYKSKYGAVLLILFLVPVTLLIHDFWTYSGDQMMEEMINFMKNLAILGGLLVLTITDPGSFSVDG